MPRSLYPLQIVEAARYLDNLKKDAKLKPKDSWDGSVVSLLNDPEIVRMMSDDLDWTQTLSGARSPISRRTFWSPYSYYAIRQLQTTSSKPTTRSKLSRRTTTSLFRRPIRKRSMCPAMSRQCSTPRTTSRCLQLSNRCSWKGKCEEKWLLGNLLTSSGPSLADIATGKWTLSEAGVVAERSLW